MIRFEHIAFNVPDVHAVAKWDRDTLGFVVMRQQDVPPHMTFIADADKNMMFEFYSNAAVPSYDGKDVPDFTAHVAFHVDDMDAVRAKLIAAGATPSGDVTTTPAGDKLAFLRDPFNVVTLQLVQRTVRML